MYEYLLRKPALWLSVYACGSVLTIGATASGLNAGAAGTVAVFLILAGTIGYESLSRLMAEKMIRDRVNALNMNHDRLTREVSRTRGEIDTLKDDMTRTAGMMKMRTEPDAAPAPQDDKKIQKSFERMGSRGRGTVSTTVQKYQDLLSGAANKNIKMGETKIMPRFSDKDEILVPHELEREMQNAVPDYNDMIVSELLHHAVQSDRVEIFAQPIVRLPSRRLVYLEVFARIRARAGVYLPADRYRKLAEEETLISDVDHLLLMHVLDSIRADARRGVEIGYFINISSATLQDVGFMSDLLEFIKRSRDLAPGLIFELQQADLSSLSYQSMEIIRGLGKAGCRFSVDNIVDTYVDVKLFRSLNIEFVKLDAAKLVLLADAPEGEALIQRLKANLDSVNMTLIVEKLESERDLKELLDFEVDYGEGYLFGKPDLEIAYRPKRAA